MNIDFKKLIMISATLIIICKEFHNLCICSCVYFCTETWKFCMICDGRHMKLVSGDKNLTEDSKSTIAIEIRLI